jgi:hypothetical protein
VQRTTLLCASGAHTATTKTMCKELQPRLVTRNVDQEQSMQESLPRSISAVLHNSASNCAQMRTRLHGVLCDMATIACLCIDVAVIRIHEATNEHQARLDSSGIFHLRIAPVVVVHLFSKKLGRRLRGRSQTVTVRLFVRAHYILPDIQCSLHPSVHEQPIAAFGQAHVTAQRTYSGAADMARPVVGTRSRSVALKSSAATVVAWRAAPCIE